MLTICGANCTGCPNMNKECQGGCEAVKGRVYWARYIGVEVCPVYACVESKKYMDCGDCSQLPCETWVKLKDPSMSNEQHQKSIIDRVALLKKGK
jgi:hypothetical protein